jgi:molybdopterin-guanine dinucleotide biosynthesis protein MobB
MSLTDNAIPIVGFVAPSGTGKTTLLCQLLPMLKAAGIRTAVIKHSHHDFEIDKPGKDSYELRHAGAEQMLIASRQRLALIREKGAAEEADLAECLRLLERDQVDLIIVEGFKFESFPKIELYRAEVGKPPLYPNDRDIIAVLSDTAIAVGQDIDLLDLNRIDDIFHYLVKKFHLTISENSLNG